ncbi:porin family protein [Hufsiella ginkgonis]|uniref:Outer membrane beta-barrel protein n=1 Tax=Hufsiella ginkgonis TaxID=2695274 RepID=A0A7K1Y2Z9_9SPHI|nr:porin family protein [Hufsiella ginkgonis]MXV17602.1 outer membrane beta-barrel protein [Hufsiella ginkgonis]
MNPIRNYRLCPAAKNCLILVFLLLPLLTLAQRSRSRGNFNLGFTVSPNLGWIKFDENNGSYTGNGAAVGYSYGILGDFGFTDNYFFGTGFTITTMAADADVVPTSGGAAMPAESINYKFKYIEIPLTLKLKTSPDGDARFYGQFGPDLGIKVSSKHTVTRYNIEDDASLVRFGLLIGAGAEWKLKNSTVLTGLSFNNPINKVFTDPGARNYVIALNLGVFF